jgi:hypothetical protein
MSDVGGQRPEARGQRSVGGNWKLLIPIYHFSLFTFHLITL